MKKMSVLASLYLLFSISSMAAETTTKEQKNVTQGLFYDHAHFTRLTEAEQRSYLRELQSIFAEMSEKSDYFSQNIMDSESRWAILLQLENAYAADNLTEELKPVTESIARMAKAMQQIEELKKKSGSYESDEIQKLYEAAVIEYANAQKKFSALKDRSNSHEPYKAAKENLTQSEFFIIDYNSKVKTPSTVVKEYFREKNSKKKSDLLTDLASGKIDPAVQIDVSNIPVRLSASENPSPDKIAAEKPPVAAQPSPVKITAAPPKPPISAPEPKPISDENSRKLAALADGYACMNSGFIIKTPPCVAPKNLSSIYKLTDLKDPNAFSCPEGQQVCNPFLFGFKPNACKLQMLNTPNFKKECLNKDFKPGELPYCVRNNSLATQQCSDLSKGTDSITNAVELIKMNPQAWNEYRNDFFKLCDEDYVNFNNLAKFNRTRKVTESYIRNDIKKTCEVAKKRVAILNERFHVETAPIKLNSGSGNGSAPAGTK